MIPYSATLGYSTLLDRLSEESVVELDRLLREVEGLPPGVQQEALMDLLPELGDQYVGASSLVSAQFFAELQEMQGIRNPIAPETLDSVPRPRWHALAGWGTSGSVFERGGAALMYSLVSGGLTKILTEVASDTMIGNAELQGGNLSAQRVPRPGCCAWCGMLASRGAVYTAETAGKVVGRGVPVGQGKGRGTKGKGRGIKARGSRRMGEDYHDHCRCRVVILTDKNEAELQSTADKYYDAYADAYKATGKNVERNVITYMDENGDRHNLYEWVDQEGDILSDKQRRSRIVAHMREELGVK